MKPHARVSNVSSFCGHLCQFDRTSPESRKLVQRFSSDTLTEEKLDELMNEFITFVLIRIYKNSRIIFISNTVWQNLMTGKKMVGLEVLT